MTSNIEIVSPNHANISAEFIIAAITEKLAKESAIKPHMVKSVYAGDANGGWVKFDKYADNPADAVDDYVQ